MNQITTGSTGEVVAGDVGAHRRRSTTRPPASSRPRSTSRRSTRSTAPSPPPKAAFAGVAGDVAVAPGRGDVPPARAGRRATARRSPSLAHRRARQGARPTRWARSPAASRTSSSPAASRTCSRAATASRPRPASTCTRSASRSAWWPASRRSTSRPWCRCGCSPTPSPAATRSSSSRREKDPSASLFMAELLKQAGLPDGVFNVVHGDKVAVDRILEHPDIAAVSFVGSTPIARYIYETGTPQRQAGAGARRRQEPHGRAARRRPRHGRRRRGQRRATARPASAAWPSASWSPSGDVADRSSTPSTSRMPKIKVGPGTEPGQRDGPAHHRRAPRQGGRLPRRRRRGGRHGRGRRPRAPRRPATASSSACRCSTTSSPGMACYDDEIFGPVLSVVRVDTYDEACALVNDNPYGNGTAIFTRDGGAARQFQFDMQGRHGRHQRAHPRAGGATTASAAGRRRCSATPTCTAPRASTSTPAPRSSRPAGPTRATSRVDLGFPRERARRHGRSGSCCRPTRRRGGWSTWPSGPSSLGFTYVWTFDSHILWEEPFVIYSQILAETRKVIVGPMVTNPATRDWTVTASARSPRSTRCTATAPSAASAAATRRCGSPTASPPRWPRCARPSTSSASSPTGARSTTRARTICASRGRRRAGSTCGWPPTGRRRWRSTGEVGDGFILQLADPDIAAWTHQGRARGGRSAPGAIPTTSRSASPRPPTSATTSPTMRDQCRWFGGMVGNHVADIVARYGDRRRRRARRRSPTTSRAARATTTTSTAGPATPTPQFVPDEIVDRFCILGPAERPRRAPGGAEATRRRPVRHLPPARRQGRDVARPTASSIIPQPERHRRSRSREAEPLVRRRAAPPHRRCSSVALVARRPALWELLQGDRPGDGRRARCSASRCAQDERPAMPHVWDMVHAARSSPSVAPAVATVWRAVVAGRAGTRSSSPCSGFVIGVVRRAGPGHR